MLRALYEHGIATDVIVDTSAGAINGAFVASRPQTVDTADELAAVWRGPRRNQVFPVNPVTGMLRFFGSRDHLVPDSGLRRLIGAHVEHVRLEQLPIPLHVVAVDVITGEELRLSSGPVTDAVLASSSVPGVLPPVCWQDRALMDGGVANKTPISHAVELGSRQIYVLPTGQRAMKAGPRVDPVISGLPVHAVNEKQALRPDGRPVRRRRRAELRKWRQRDSTGRRPQGARTIDRASGG
jgi:NTE family protein